MTADNDRSWKHMVDSGTTITWEAWDQRYKPNQDWNHAWGAAPANLLPRFVLGAQPLTPGWTTATIRPSPGNLEIRRRQNPDSARRDRNQWENGETFKLSTTLPEGNESPHPNPRGRFESSPPQRKTRLRQTRGRLLDFGNRSDWRGDCRD